MKRLSMRKKCIKNKKGDAEEARLQEQDKYADECAECAEAHRQLAEWLKELKERRAKNE
jgi:hypothetical protein